MSAEGPRRGVEELPPPSPFAEAIGIETVSTAHDEVVTRLAVTERITNRNGVLHGGALMTVADNAAGTVAFLHCRAEQTNTTVEAKTNFMRPVSVGDALVARCVPLHAGRKTLVLQVTMTRGDGKVVAVTTQTHLLMDWRG